jgi:O-antigen/teichoic acid export membrane protein
MAAVVLFEMIKSGGLQSALVMRVASSTAEQKRSISGSAYWLGGIFSLSISVVLFLLYFLGVFSNQPAIEVFCGWYAIVGLLTLPLHIAEAEAVAAQDLKFLFWLRMAQSANTFLIAGYAWYTQGGLKGFATMHVLFNAVLLLAVLGFKKTNPLHILHKTIAEVKQLYHLIKYTLATMATTNLLKTADTFLIGSLMGPAAVAKYAIPLKLTELFEIPLRSLSTTAFPQLAAHHNQRDYVGFRNHFIQFLSWAYIFYIPALIGAFVFAPYIVLIIGGQQYADTTPIFRVFILFGLFLPANRMTGISLDALQLPAKNFQKVLIMALINIFGDFIAIKWSNQLEWVAFVSVINAAAGAMIGWWMLQQSKMLPKGNLLKDVAQYIQHFIRQLLVRFKILSNGQINNGRQSIL